MGALLYMICGVVTANWYEYNWAITEARGQTVLFQTLVGPHKVGMLR